MNTYSATQKGPLRVAGYIDPSDVTVITIYWGAPVFEASAVYRLGDICRPTTDNGYYYTCTTAGVSGSSEPSTWSQSTQISGTAILTAVPYDLWVLPDEQLQTQDLELASEWTATEGVTLTDPLNDLVATSVVISAVSEELLTFEVTNTVRKSTGEKLSRTFLYRVNEQ